MPPIPLVDLGAQHRSIREEMDRAIQGCLEKSAFIGGEEHDRFEAEFAEYQGAAACAGVANGTDAITLSLRVMGIGRDDIVITSPFTFIATCEAITLNGARPVFADIDIDTFNLSPRALRSVVEAMSSDEKARLKAILPVHLYGRPADVRAICALAQEFGLMVLEDCAQAHGAGIDGKRVGTFGDAGTFSFYPAKNLGACGDAGAVVSKDAERVHRVRELRNHGRAEHYRHRVEGVNSRLDGIQAAILRVKLRHLEGWNEQRRRWAALYRELLAPCPRVVTPPVVPGSVYHLYTIRHPDREALRARLTQAGISSAVHYPIALHMQPAYAHLGIRAGAFPEAERAGREVLSLPLYPEMGEEAVRTVCRAILEFEGV